VFEVQGITATEGDICGEGGARFLRYEGKGTFKKGDVTMTLNADASIPNFIEKLADIKFNWGITTDKGLVSAGTTLHTFYHVLGKPIDNGLPEDGATTRRMDTATDWILKTGCKEPVDIVKALFGKFPGYILGFSMLSDELKNEIKSDLLLKKALLDAGFADYRKDNLGGAWPLAEFQKFGGECQAIVRLIRGIIHQVGCPGTIELKFVNADAPNYLEGIIKSVGTTCSGPDPKKGYSLVDGKVQVGNTYDGNDGVGFNNYEAYMKYSYVNSSGKSRVAWFG
jgi:hypothetical protein